MSHKRVTVMGTDKQHFCPLQRLLYNYKHSDQPMVYLSPTRDLFPHYATEINPLYIRITKHFTSDISLCYNISTRLLSTKA